MIRFDAYSATTTEANPYQLVDLFGPGLKQREGRGFHSFGRRVALADDSGHEVGAVMWGGRHGERAMIEVKGERSPGVVEALRSRFPHRVTRVDACADFDAPGAFDRLYRACRRVKVAHGILGGKAGDWDDFPEKGRTLYLGSPQSPTRMRLYEKGKQREYEHLGLVNWARIEAQVRPAKEAKTAFAELSPVEVWGASKWTRELAAKVLHQHVDPHPAGTVYRRTSLDRRIEWICKQCGPTILELAAEVGSIDCAMLTIGEKLKSTLSRKDEAL